MALDRFSYDADTDLRVIDRLDEFILELDTSKITFVNPETKNTIRVSTALTYDKSHPAYKLAKQIVKTQKSAEKKFSNYVQKEMPDEYTSRELGNVETGRALLSRTASPKEFETLPFEQKISMVLASQDGIESEVSDAIDSAWQSYGGDGYIGINKHLRGKQPAVGAYASNLMKKRIQLLDTLFKSDSTKLKQPIVVYRGISSAKMVKKLIENRRDTFVDDGFVSTSLARKVGNAFADQQNFSARMKIIVPKGKHAIYLRGIKKLGLLKEHEVVLPRRTRFKVVDFKRLKTKHGKVMFEVIAEAV